ncbi:hypothetical protein [Nocardia blacklockiae]|uniref:hypothetical protein n=1 Tax=Nocardia blacklockiae TaxID=480036 RepID=UPI001894A0EB|nr:hypothetical protein [Nocardia blacklockiae]MBF6171112.1 hypothetical protein [Nocardia blacklockiae]
MKATQLMTSEIRADVERRYRDQMPPEWDSQQRAAFVESRTSELEQQIQQATEPLFEHNLAHNRETSGREPDYATVVNLRSQAREQAMEIARGQLFEGYDEPDPEPGPWEQERVIGEQLDTVWMTKPPMQRWATPWADPVEDDDLFDLAAILLPGAEMTLLEPAMHLLQAMRAEGMELPTAAGDPAHQQMVQVLRRGLEQENERRAGVGMPTLPVSL